MPLPVYQRELGWSELSTRTATTLTPETRCGVTSYAKLTYPYGRFPRCAPLIQMSLFM